MPCDDAPHPGTPQDARAPESPPTSVPPGMMVNLRNERRTHPTNHRPRDGGRHAVNEVNRAKPAVTGT